MILDGRNGFGHQASPLHYDVCVVGAGPAGITLALELEATKLRVCLLEAGGTTYERATQQLFEGEVVADNYPLLRDTRLGALGGSTNVWAGWCRPLEPIDFEERDWCNADGWPFRLDDLQPYYARAHEICGLGPYDTDPDYWSQALGRNRLLTCDANFTNQVFHVNPQNFGHRFYAQLEQSKSIDLVLRAPVSRILPRHCNGRGKAR